MLEVFYVVLMLWLNLGRIFALFLDVLLTLNILCFLLMSLNATLLHIVVEQ